MSDLVHCREQAEHARDRAAVARSADLRQSWLDIAESFDSLAKAQEKIDRDSLIPIAR